MRIEAVSLQVPSKRRTNEDVLQDVARYNAHGRNDRAARLQKLVRSLLTRCGAQTRYFRDLSANESALSILRLSIDECLDRAAIRKGDVDLLIYFGVRRGFVEPATAYFVAKSVGMRCECFDVGDACMGWLRAADLAQQMLRSHRYRRILLASAEFNVYECGYPESCTLGADDEDIESFFSGLTVGEAASVTILSDRGDDWVFAYDSHPELASLCTIPLKHSQQFTGKEDVRLRGDEATFFCEGSSLTAAAREHLPTLVSRCVDASAVDLWIPHSVDQRTYIRELSRLGVDEVRVMGDVFPNYGNIVSCAIPAGIAMALEQERLARGDRLVFCPASAGMVFAVSTCTY